jgi:copper chaperone CopZ
MAKKVQLKNLKGNTVQTIYPQTSADNVMYDSDTTTKEVVDALILEIRRLEKLLSIDSLYILDEDGETLLNDGEGNNLVAVASLIGNEESTGT